MAEASNRLPRSPLESHAPATSTAHCHVRRDHHRRWNVGLGGGHSAGVLRSARLHSRTAHDHRRAEFVLSAGRPKLRCRPACRHQFHRPRGPRRGRLARLLKQLRFSWDDFSLVPQIGSAIMFPGVTLRFNNDFDSSVRKSIARFRRERQFSPACRERLRLRRSGPASAPVSRPGSRRRDHSRSAAGRNVVLPADVLRQRARGRHGFRASSASCSAAFSWKALRGRLPACADPQEAGAEVPATWRRTAIAGRRAATASR